LLIGHDCVTPFQAVVVLKAHRGLYNRSAELVKLNRGKLKNISSAFSGLDSKLKKFVGRANDIIFSLKEPVKRNVFSTLENYDSINDIPSFSRIMYLHSGNIDDQEPTNYS
jgi:hypothetical protein